jgi:hypothetical protein
MNDWNNFLIEGDEWYNYMTNNYNTMFNNNKIKHMDIRYDYIYDYGTTEIKEKYIDDIEDKLYKWIKQELESNKLFIKEQWKPFRDKYILTYMYLGYKTLFKYNNYYFQLIIDNYCNIDECIYCNSMDNNIHFGLSLYGWEEDGIDLLQPYNTINIPVDNIMPEMHWKRQ